MCGFFFSNKKIDLSKWNFEDVKSRGIFFKDFYYEDCYAIQSILPCTSKNIDFSLFENNDHIFLFTGEIYNYDRKYFNDTEMVYDDLKNNKNISHYNGMYAYVFYDKKTKILKYGRDKTGQIPLFIYKKDDHIILSNTIKSIVKITNVNLNKNSLRLWKKTKHFIFYETPWQNIFSVKPNNQKEQFYKNESIHDIFYEIKSNYDSHLKSASINSGGVDSGIISKWFGEFQVALNHIGKDYISNELDFAFNITQDEWSKTVDEFIEKTYLFPYTWSWIGYYILGKKLKNKINILYTGEGADEIFGGYPGYKLGVRTPYSYPYKINEKKFLISNKLADQKYFIPVSTMGANIALGCFTIEPRSPFLDRQFLNNNNFINEDDKRSLKNYYELLYNKEPAIKQGFAGFPDEYGKPLTWKDKCYCKLEEIFNIHN